MSIPWRLWKSGDGVTRNLTVKALGVTKGGQPVNKSLAPLAVPAANNLAVTVTDWNAVDL